MAPAPPVPSSTAESDSTPAPFGFSTSFDAFRLPPPRSSSSQLSSPMGGQPMQEDGAGLGEGGDGMPVGGALFNRRVSPAGFVMGPGGSLGLYAGGNGMMSPTSTNSNLNPFPTTPPSTSTPMFSSSFSFNGRKSSNLTQEVTVEGEGPSNSSSQRDVSDDVSLGSSEPLQRSGSDSPMILGSPGFETALSGLPGRSRSISGGSTSMPTSPIILARALGREGQKTPPFLQRKLFNGMDEDLMGSGSGSTSSESSSTHNNHHHHGRRWNLGTRGKGGGLADDEEAELTNLDLGVAINAASTSASIIPGANTTGSGSGSGSGEEGARVGVVRRPLSRKPNLLPKSKSHLRVLSQLRTEDGPADQLEIASEATLHRLSRSGASTIPLSVLSQSKTNQDRPSSSHGISGTSKPTPNRFPEQAEEEEVLATEDSSSSAEEGEGGGGGDAASDFGGTMSMGYGTEDEEERRSSTIWTGIRGGGMGAGTSVGGSGGAGGLAASSSALLLGGLGGAAFGRSPSSEKGRATEMDIQQSYPAVAAWQTSTRPGKRKMTEDRFEPYASAFKRRAVSPCSTGSPALGSPILNSGGPSNSSTTNYSFPTIPTFPSSTHNPHNPSSSTPSTPPPTSKSLNTVIVAATSSNTLPIPIPIPSPSLNSSHQSFFSSLNPSYGGNSGNGLGSGGMRSRAGSPASMSSTGSTRMGYFGSQAAIMGVMSGRAEKEEAERIKEAEGLGRMSLG